MFTNPLSGLKTIVYILYIVDILDIPTGDKKMKIGDIEKPNLLMLARALDTAQTANRLLEKNIGCPAVIINEQRHIIDDPEVAAALRRSIDDYIRRLKSEIRRRVISDF